MKMNSAQIQQTLHTLNAAELNAEAIPAEHPMISQLERLFGDHTYFLDNRVHVLTSDDPPPTSGILVISPFWEAGVWDDQDRYRFLRHVKPIAVIGDCMRVYDLDRLKT